MANDVISGSDLYLFMSNTPLAHATNFTLSIKGKSRNTTDKESGVYETSLPGRFTVTADADGLVAYGSFETIVQAVLARLALLLYFGRKIGDVQTSGFNASASYASGYFYPMGWDLTAPDGDNSTYKVSFEHCCGFNFITKP